MKQERFILKTVRHNEDVIRLLSNNQKDIEKEFTIPLFSNGESSSALDAFTTTHLLSSAKATASHQ